MYFQIFDTCCKNTGRAYRVTAIVGDCFCPMKNCGKPIRMSEPISGDYFFGQCSCGYYVEARIELDKNGRCGKWVIQNYADGA